MPNAFAALNIDSSDDESESPEQNATSSKGSSKEQGRKDAGSKKSSRQHQVSRSGPPSKDEHNADVHRDPKAVARADAKERGGRANRGGLKDHKSVGAAKGERKARGPRATDHEKR